MCLQLGLEASASFGGRDSGGANPSGDVPDGVWKSGGQWCKDG